jgi:acyl carrier protein
VTDLTTDVLEELRRIARKDLEYAGSISLEQSLKADLQLDSMSMIIVAVGLENRFRVKLQEEDAGALTTVNDLVQLVCRRVSEGAAT